jgi:hypothetical protein
MPSKHPVTSPARYNEIVGNPTVLTLIRYFARKRLSFSSASLVAYFDGVEGFPAFSARSLILAAQASGVDLQGERVSFEDAQHYPVPFLTYVETIADSDTNVQLMEVVRFEGRKVVISDGPLGLVSIPIERLRKFWSGPVFYTSDKSEDSLDSELDFYRYRVNIMPSVLSQSLCDDLIQYCEHQIFQRSRVTNFDPQSKDPQGVIAQKVRNSSSVTLGDRKHPVLARLYNTIARLEDVAEHQIEEIQCVRYKKGQRFTSHFDAATGVPRRATYLLYLNEGFSGGNTHFPMLDLGVEPQAGTCLRFPSCDEEGRICWQSEHGGMPVSDGTKYALNIWILLPRPVANADEAEPAAAKQSPMPATRG